MNELLQCGESVHGVLIVDRYKFNPNHVIPFEHKEKKQTTVANGQDSIEFQFHTHRKYYSNMNELVHGPFDCIALFIIQY